MGDVREVLRGLAADDRRGAVWCAALCASTVRHWMPTAALPALRLAFLWAQGVPVSEARIAAARDAADDAADYGIAPFEASVDAAEAAFNVASAAIYDAYDADDAAYYASFAVYEATAAAGGVRAAKYARTLHLEHLGALVTQQTTPLDRPGYSVLGDWLQERCKGGRVGTLGGSLAWGRQHHLRWWDTAERYAAERRIRIPSDLIAAHRRTS